MPKHRRFPKNSGYFGKVLNVVWEYRHCKNHARLESDSQPTKYYVFYFKLSHSVEINIFLLILFIDITFVVKEKKGAIHVLK